MEQYDARPFNRVKLYELFVLPYNKQIEVDGDKQIVKFFEE